MLEDLQAPIAELDQQITSTWRDLDPAGIRHTIAELESKTADPAFWDSRERAEKILQDIKRHRDRIEPWEALTRDMEDLRTLYDLAVSENDRDQEEEIRQLYDEARMGYEKLRILELLNGPQDDNPVFLTVHAGAGGTEANDWAAMLLRMYSRWAEQHGYGIQTLDYQEAEGGVKSVTLQLTGNYAFGYLRGETGVHRLVRISPFDSGGRRHTSFASVYVSPVLDDDIDVTIKPEDIRVDTYRAGGAGGQHVNKTDSAVRITHLETGIVVQCQNERSQHKNRDFAMKMLRSRLYEYYEEQRDKERQESAAEKKDISWGNQIRSYVFQPYTMVKDARTKTETGNIQAVMDGDLDPFIEAFLKQEWARKTGGSVRSNQ
ncbi:peptide chain release factor 2 [Spirochaeta lutea]|uniref:peptide chain release factor 2 n=1 Tax=Spirochaeta lutea TaxID=1480694 RepID=UPI0038B5472A